MPRMFFCCRRWHVTCRFWVLAGVRLPLPHQEPNMSIARIEKSSWRPYFDNMSRLLDGKRAEIEVDALALGSQIEAQWLPLLGITYDPRSDVVEIVLEGLDHLIHKPRDVFVDQTAVELNSMEVIDEDEQHHIVRLRDPLMLPAPMH